MLTLGGNYRITINEYTKNIEEKGNALFYKIL
jgi:hypothetical protein